MSHYPSKPHNMINFELSAQQEIQLITKITTRAEQAKLLRVFRIQLNKCQLNMEAELELQIEQLVRDQLLRHSYSSDSAPPCSSSSAIDPESSVIPCDKHTSLIKDDYYCNPINKLEK